MPQRVAVASTDGKYVNDHFGRAEQFLIFDLDETGHHFVEVRKNIPSCHIDQPEENGHARTVQLLHDCQAVVVARIGYGAEQVLAQHGIAAYTIPDFIEEALASLNASGNKSE